MTWFPPSPRWTKSAGSEGAAKSGWLRPSESLFGRSWISAPGRVTFPPPRSPALSTSPKKAPRTSLEEEARLRIEQSRKIALRSAEAAVDKKAIGVEIIDVVGKVDYADFLVIMTGTSDRHVSAIARGVDEHLSKLGTPPVYQEGQSGGEWVLLDFFDVVVHVFSEDARNLYDLSGLWLDAKRVPVPERAEPAPGGPRGTPGSFQ